MEHYWLFMLSMFGLCFFVVIVLCKTKIKFLRKFKNEQLKIDELKNDIDNIAKEQDCDLVVNKAKEYFKSMDADIRANKYIENEYIKAVTIALSIKKYIQKTNNLKL